MAGISNTSNFEISGQKRSYTLPLICLAVLYFMLGFVTVLNDTLVPFFKQGFTLTYSQSSLVQFYFYLTYGLISIPAGKLVERVGYRNGIIIGFFIAALGAFLFYPAAGVHNYALFLSALFVVAIGIVLLQVSANPFITVLGPKESAAARLTLIQGIGSVGTTVAPIFGGYFILSKLDESSSSSNALVGPYLFIGATLIIIAIVVYLLKLPIIKHDTETTQAKLGLVAILKKYSNLRYGFIALFFYVGAEVAIGTFLTNYIADRLAISDHLANYFLSYYWGGMLIGRFAGSFAMKYVSARKILSIMGVLAILLIGVSITTTGSLSVWSIVATGLCNSIMFASIFSLSVNGLDQYTGRASGLLSSAIVGGALLTYIIGVLKDNYTWEVALLIPIVCYLVIFWYGWKGAAVKSDS